MDIVYSIPAWSWDNSMNSSIQIAAYSHTGLYRKRNEDSLLVSDQVISGAVMDNPRLILTDTIPVIFAVADGLGGCVAGDIASREVLRFMAGIIPTPANENELLNCITAATENLDRIARENPALDGLGTTLAGVLVTNEDVFFFSCGDSRVYYRFPGKKDLQLMTKDHSIIQEMIDAGTLHEKDARSHPFGHVITSCLSGGKVARIPDIRISKTERVSGSRIVACTDGIWDYGGEKFLQAARIDDISGAAREIVNCCFDAGAPDNITLIIADIN